MANFMEKTRNVPVHTKESKANPRNYRPISLLSINAKAFEEIIKKSTKKII